MKHLPNGNKMSRMDKKSVSKKQLLEDIEFEREVALSARNQELMKFLEERSRSEKTYSLEEVRKSLGLA